MVEVLGCGTFSVPSQMPIEIDVYSDPHSRMKELVNSVVENIQQEILNLNSKERDEILQSVYLTMWELKTHEIIENMYIMNKLRDRLDTLKVYNKVVCNCHEDSSLLNIIELVEYLHSSVDSSSTHYYWQRLQSAVYEFMDEFLPHMEEEENTFQPLLCKYFNFEELKLIKETVLEQHRLWKNKVEQEKNLNFFKENLQENEREAKRSTSYCDKLRELEQNLNTDGESIEPLVKLQAETETPSPVYFIPGEILMKILQFLSPRDLLAAGATCRRWYDISLTPRMWKILPLSSWEQGELTWRDESPDLDLVERRTDLMEVNEDEIELDFFSAFSR
ncbi:F-box/LRR-repeat protein 5 [Eurytemora carolleeae]|uniref:F-box/LRR-repeat protein 5 n=1 Tax=Eurytemora carolleeae TaxID=1294199 RepID=UPI000C760904|nr:F-box/LRR-repeat protein 5 [Eurytemora carolleeae]|eukprot:XP_023324232.1 F-box/LRR-repeat protein 5-like [Eurytemora affinis]